MVKNTVSMNKIFIILLLLTMCACTEKSALKEETVYVANENKDWIGKDSIGSDFLMTDNNSITQSFSMYQNSSDLSPSTSSYFGVKTKTIITESYSQGYSSIYGQRISYILTAGHAPFGDNLCISINDILFAYDFKFNTISRINFGLNYKSKQMTGKGYEETEKIFSTVELNDTLTLGGQLYSGVMHFKFMDFNDKWTKYTVTEMFFAKHYGLIEYSLNNGITYERQN